MKAAMQKHGHNDWCHLCGKRNDNNVGIWFPENAEHDLPAKPGPVTRARNYIRICAGCAQWILDTAGVTSDTTEFKGILHDQRQAHQN